MDCEKLINEVQKRLPLWDVKNKDYSNRNKTADLWEEIAQEMCSTKTEVVKKWKSLRDNYRQELKKVARFQRSGNDSSHVFKRKWIFFEQMTFLKDILRPAPMPGNLPSIPGNDTEDISENADETSTSNPEIAPNETAATTLQHTTCTGQVSPSGGRRKCLKRKREDDPFLAIEREKLSILQSNREITMDGDYNFLISFVPIMKQMNDVQKLHFRVKMSALVLEIMSGPQPPVSREPDQTAMNTQ
ncbi:uncharacterized protein [Anabrus simplex]|uniref:uncharacterized protein n=1 Tax=Anabrus simplex TaxID=316456 RepID=UPI0034DD4E69